MRSRSALAIAAAALTALTSCAVRMIETPTAAVATAPKKADAAPAPRPAAPAAPAPAAGEPARAQAGSAIAVSTPRPAAAAPAQPANLPPATDSVYVFAPQQTAATRAVAAAAPAVPAPRAPASAPGEAPAPNAVPEAPVPAPKSEDPAQAPKATGSLVLSVVSTPGAVPSGEIVSVDVIASTDAAVVDAPLHLSFDPKVVAFVDGTPGDFLTQGGSSVVFFADGTTHPGDVAVAAGRIERAQGANGAGLLCRLRFRGVAAGTTPVVVGQAKAWGTDGQELAVTSEGTTAVVR
jgi:hypothetical protein